MDIKMTRVAGDLLRTASVASDSIAEVPNLFVLYIEYIANYCLTVILATV